MSRMNGNLLYLLQVDNKVLFTKSLEGAEQNG